MSTTDTVSGQNVAISKVKDTFLVQDVMTSPSNAQHFDDIYIVTNLMESDMGCVIRSHQVLTDQHLQYLLFQILRGLEHEHSADVVCAAPRPQVSTLRASANCDLALCDFGLAVDLDCLGPQPQKLQTIVTKLGLPPQNQLLFVHSQHSTLQYALQQMAQPPDHVVQPFRDLDKCAEDKCKDTCKEGKSYTKKGSLKRGAEGGNEGGDDGGDGGGGAMDELDDAHTACEHGRC
ncbi:hypothetical protein B484DRAFT_394459 [Ochromonadaceae sp. CCMP2298]|nr:hypothetical protein B484DRAFT_395007 [Ochromonadaceae sp. CCMP2298]KAJ1433618.1 hypothetical protein B484DRAFT_394459 [Ochromonadaceae sp. CCMP2298]